MSTFKNRLATSFIATSVLLVPPMLHAEVIFEESFDAQPDWVQTDDPSPYTLNERHADKGDIIPVGWDFARVDAQWAPSTGHLDRHESIEISAVNVEKAYGGVGKSVVFWRDHYASNGRWNSEGILMKRLEPQTEIYVEYKIRFSPGIYQSYLDGNLGESKIFRVYAWSNPSWEQPFRYFDGTNHPEIVWNLVGDERYGIRNKIALLGINADLGAPDMPARAAWGSGWSLSFKTDIDGRVPGVPEIIPDQKNGGFIDPDISGVASMERVFGPPGTWNKMAFYAKLNSAPGVFDGVLSQYLNGQRILHTEQVAWIPDGEEMRSWNVVGIGGNDATFGYPNELRREDWYAIDELKIMNQVPEKLFSDAAPNPPSSIAIE
jgi:hypothetical protein